MVEILPALYSWSIRVSLRFDPSRLGAVAVASAVASVIDIGETAVLSSGDGGNGNLLLAQSATLAQAATI